MKLSQPVSELKAPDTGTSVVVSDDSEATADSGTLQQQESIPVKAASVAAHLSVIDADGHGRHREIEEREDNSTSSGSNNHHKTKLKKKKKRKKEELDEVPADPTSTSVTPDHLRYFVSTKKHTLIILYLLQSISSPHLLGRKATLQTDFQCWL